MSEILDANIIVNGQKSIATVAQGGTIVEDNGVLDANCIVQTANGKQKAIKTYLVGVSGNAGIIKFSSSLPETGEEGFIYGVMTDVTRQGYAIIQLFVWANNEWCAIGAFDVDINPTGIVYEQSFNASTGTWTVTVNQ